MAEDFRFSNALIGNPRTRIILGRNYMRQFRKTIFVHSDLPDDTLFPISLRIVSVEKWILFSLDEIAYT